MAPRQIPRPGPKGKGGGVSNSRINRSGSVRGPYTQGSGPSNPTTPGARIKAARKALGWSQQALGARLLTDQTTVSAWERDKVEKLAGPSLVALAVVLQTTPEALLSGIGWERPIPGGAVAPSQRVAEAYGEDMIQLPPAPAQGLAYWMPRHDAGSHAILEAKDLETQVRGALKAGRPVWVVVE